MKNAVDAAANEREMKELDERLAAEEAKAQARLHIQKSKQILSAVMMQNAVDLAGKDREEKEALVKQQAKEAEGNSPPLQCAKVHE